MRLSWGSASEIRASIDRAFSPWVCAETLPGTTPQAGIERAFGPWHESEIYDALHLVGLRVALARAAGAGGALQLLLWRRRGSGRHVLVVEVQRHLCVVDHFDPSGVGRCAGGVFVVPVPPLVWFGLGVTCGRVLPDLLASERGHVEVAPDGTHGFVAAVVDEVSAKHFVAFADERVRAVPFVHAEVGV